MPSKKTCDSFETTTPTLTTARATDQSTVRVRPSVSEKSVGRRRRAAAAAEEEEEEEASVAIKLVKLVAMDFVSLE